MGVLGWPDLAWVQRVFPAAAAKNTDSVDGTIGLTRSGTMRLVADCSASRVTTIGGVESHWIRGRLASILPPARAGVLPSIDRIRLRTIIAPSVGNLRLFIVEAGDEKQVTVDATYLAWQGIDLTDSFATLSDPEDDKNTFPVQSLTPGTAQWVGTEENKAYVLEVTVPGFTNLNEKVTPAKGKSLISLSTDFSGSPLDKAITDGVPVDLSTTFFPFGQNPQSGASFAVLYTEAMEKPGATVTLHSELASTGRLTTNPSASSKRF